jgi:primosomal protein N' (replication factor Y)
MPVVRVALDVPVDRAFDYRTDAATEADIGRLAVVPFGRGRKVGVVVGVAAQSELPDARLRDCLRIARDLPALPQDVLALAAFCADYYRATPGEVLAAALPTALRRPEALTPRPVRGWALVDSAAVPGPEGFPKQATTRRALIIALRAGPMHPDAVLAFGTTARRALADFEASGWVQRIDLPPTPASDASIDAPSGADPASDRTSGVGPALRPAQRAAVETIAATFGRFSPHLLQGVTGSGKTEVYLHLADRAMHGVDGAQTLLLVPEIHLTPQLETALAARFGVDAVVALHSGLADGERLARWQRAQRGAARVIVGTRLAVFTPLPHLALIVVDEEHDASYKQQEGVRYHARDLAVWRARARGVPIVLGSATPSIESWRHAQAGRYAHARLPERANGVAPPPIRLIDVRTRITRDGLSDALVDAIAARVASGEQSLVFVNRRGYAPAVVCHACGWTAPCPRCSARLTLHLRRGRLLCHWCGHDEPVTEACPSCGNLDLRPRGEGTQRVEQALAERLPQARITRVDRDAMRRRGAFAQVRAGVAAREIDVLVGTQMLAKGHDFPRLTLVGVVGADQGLFSVDFRAEERLYALVTQVAGRAGRADRAGEVLIQTAFPEHPLYAALVEQNFDAFAAGQWAARARYGFPPAVHQVLLRADGPDEREVHAALDAAARAARATGVDGVAVHDPVAAPLARVADRWRAQLLLQSTSRSALRRLLDAWTLPVDTRRVRVVLDVDPTEP